MNYLILSLAAFLTNFTDQAKTEPLNFKSYHVVEQEFLKQVQVDLVKNVAEQRQLQVEMSKLKLETHNLVLQIVREHLILAHTKQARQ